MASANRLRAFRLIHNYSGVFFAPAILFFAITGSLQMFGLHETNRGSSYVPPAVLTHLAQLHKKGTLFLASRRPEPKPAALKPEPAKPAPVEPPSRSPHSPLPIKVFFALTGLGLVVSTCTGLYMAWMYTRSTRTDAAVFLEGVIDPLILLIV